MIERHYTISELADLLSMSLERVRQLIMDEPGVLRFAPDGKRGKSQRTMYRIPESVVQRILRRNANPSR
jgi:MarR-like DNA-binding transcriptional regulator SgrR of sgrS sRNA